MATKTIIWNGEEITVRPYDPNCEAEGCPHWQGFGGLIEGVWDNVWLCWQCPVCQDTDFTPLENYTDTEQSDTFE